MTSQNGCSANEPLLHLMKSHGEVDLSFMERVEKYQGKPVTKIGSFDLSLLQNLCEQVNEHDIIGEVEVFAAAGNKMRDGTTSGLIVIRCNLGCHDEKHFALAGLTDKVEL